jgi:uncharacterized membrane protein YgcG
MKHKRTFNWPLISLAVFLLWGSAISKDVVKSSWTVAPPAIDGVSGDWAGASFLTEKGVKVDYAFMNDGSHLYVFLAFKDPKYLSNIETTGINVYFNTEGKKKTDQGLRFYKRRVTGDEVIAIMEKRGEPLTDQDRASLQGQKIFYLYDWQPIAKDKEAVVLASSGTRPDYPVFKGKMIENAWTYEFKIPLANNETQPLGIGAGAGQTIKIGFEWGGLTEEMKKAAAARRGGRGNPTVIDMSASAEGLGGGGGGGGRSGVTGGGGSQGGGSPKQYDFWLDVQLAANK